MTNGPRGEPRTVPDPAGEQYERDMAMIKAKRIAEDRGFQSPLDIAQDALRDFQDGPRIQRPTLGQSFIPVIGPAWEAAADLQEGDYGGAALNTAMAVADVLPVGAAAKGAKSLSKGIGVLKNGSLTANASRKALRRAEVAKPGQEIHHTVPLKGTPRNVQDWRNHYALLKVLPVEQHRRLTGSWKGKPRYDPIRRIWYGTTDWQKSVPTALAAYAADAVENLTRALAPEPATPPPAKTKR